MAGHLTQSPDLTLLPEAERDIVGKALAKPPQDRWPSCRAFVERLAERGAAGGRQEPEPALRRAVDVLSTQWHRQAAGVAALMAVAKFTERIWPLVVEETADRPKGRCYSLRDLGPPQPEGPHPIPLGSRVFWSILWDQDAHLLLLDEGPEGNVFCLCPSWFVPDTRLRPGRTLFPPEEAGCEPFVVTGIPGREHLLAIITKQPLGLDWMPPEKQVPARVLSQGDIDRLVAVLARLEPGSWTALTTYCDVVVPSR
jgi:hypothetical protein